MIKQTFQVICKKKMVYVIIHDLIIDNIPVEKKVQNIFPSNNLTKHT